MQQHKLPSAGSPMIRILLITLTFSAVHGQSVRDEYTSAITAYQAGEADAFLNSAEELNRLRPGSPTMLYLKAAALAMSDDGEAAVDLLGQIADMGVAVQADKEPAFASLIALDGFRSMTNRFDALREPAGEMRVEARWDNGHFIPEQVLVLDDGSMLVGSVRERRIVRIHDNGVVSDFVAAGDHGLMSVFGMKMDADRVSIWVASTGAREAESIDESLIGRSGVFRFSLADGSLLEKHMLPASDTEQWLGDLFLLDDRVLATDSKTGEIWCLQRKHAKWRRLVASGRLASPQGIAPGNGSSVYVADYTAGLFTVDLANGRVQRLPVAPAINVYGIDGLYRYNNWLIGIQNGHQPHKVSAWRIDGGRVVEQRILVSGHPEFDDPTLGQVVDNRLVFVANSHWPSFDAERNLPAREKLSGPLIASLSLEELR